MCKYFIYVCFCTFCFSTKDSQGEDEDCTMQNQLAVIHCSTAFIISLPYSLLQECLIKHVLLYFRYLFA